MFQPNTILHPTDFSVFSGYAFRLALDLAQQYGATLIVLHVAETLGPENVTYGEATSQLEPEGYQLRLQRDLQQLTPPAGYTVPIRHVLVEGNPATEIENIARSSGCDLIVMGTHGRTGFQRLLMGSIAEQVVRQATCPVLTIKTPLPPT